MGGREARDRERRRGIARARATARRQNKTSRATLRARRVNGATCTARHPVRDASSRSFPRRRNLSFHHHHHAPSSADPRRLLPPPRLLFSFFLSTTLPRPSHTCHAALRAAYRRQRLASHSVPTLTHLRRCPAAAPTSVLLLLLLLPATIASSDFERGFDRNTRVRI